MQQQEQTDFMTKWKNNFNWAYSVALVHQRCLVIPMRKGFGVQALGTPCALALVLMAVWGLCTRDMLLWAWAGLWSLYFLVRRAESVKLGKSGAKVHSQYDGWPFDAIRIGRTEKMAKLVVEPLLVVILGGLVFWGYQQMHWPPYGLPYFLLAGGFTLPFVETVKQKIWERRTQSMIDARVEQEQLMQDVRDRYGDS
jgi:hypothetical protein